MKTITRIALTAALMTWIAAILYALMLNPWSALWLSLIGLAVLHVVNAVLDAREDAAWMAAEDRAELDRQFRRVELEGVLGRKSWTKS